MTLEEFAKDLREDVQTYAITDGNFSRSAFVDCCANRLQEANILSDFTPCFYKGTGEKKRALELDGYSFDELDDSFSLLVADYRKFASEASITRTDANSLFARVKNFIQESLTGRLKDAIEDSHPAHGLVLELLQRRGSTVRFKLYIVTDAVMSERIKELPEESVAEFPCDFHIWDLTRFYRAAASPTGDEDLEIDFSGNLGGIPCLSASIRADDYQAYLCVLPADVLADAYDRYGSRLLEGNVRAFLSNKVKVNKSIRQTILSQPSMFFAYNNGIACTASTVEIESVGGQLLLKKAVGLQIVNGGQSTASLSMARRLDKASLAGIFIQMKLSVVPPETSIDIVPAISRSANSQNKVSDADFFSNHEFHRRMEGFSRRIWAPATSGAQHETHWFYERARGQYLNEQSKLSKREKDRFLLQNPRNQLITKTDLAKTENAWRQLPHEVSLGAQKNFIIFSRYAEPEWSKDSDQFNERYFRDVVARMILFKRTEDIVSNEPWYEGGYRANIVAYAIARLSLLIDSEFRDMCLDFARIWNRQSLSEVLDSQLRIISKAVADVVTSPESGFSNVTEWAKKQACWQRAAKVPVQIMDGFEKELTLKLYEVSEKKSSKEEQKILSGIERQVLVYELGAAYWERLGAWAQSRMLFTPDEMGIVTVAAAIPNKRLSEKQSWRLVDLKQRAEAEGFVSSAR
jgi:hypothetical protein